LAISSLRICKLIIISDFGTEGIGSGRGSYPKSRLINKLVLENLKHRWVRTALSITAIAVQVTLVLTLVGLSEGLLEDQKKRSRALGADIIVRAPTSSALSMSINMPAGILGFIRKQPHVAAAAGAEVQSTGFLTTVTGIDIDDFSNLTGGFRFVAGGPFQKPDDAIIDSYYAAQHKLRVGDSHQILNRPWRVAGIVQPGMLARLFVRLDVLQDLTSNPGKLSVIYVKLDDPARTSEMIVELKTKLKDYQISSIEEFTSLISVNNIPMLQEFIGVIIGVGVLVGFLVVFLSMYTAVLERTREIGILKALGASPGYILSILMRETTVLAVAGSAFGIALSYGTRWLIRTVAPGSLIQAIVPEWWPIAAAVALVGAWLGAAYPGMKAARQDAIEALAYE
jgi:putative ABC transport system permease protein